MPLFELSLLSPDVLRIAFKRLAIAGLVLCIAGCASRRPAPVEERSPRAAPPVTTPAPLPAPPAQAGPEPEAPGPTYTVKRGDTLYLIALDHGLEYRDLAAWNNIENPNLIRIGQVLRLSPPGAPPPAAAGAAEVQTAPLKTVPPVVAGEAASTSLAAPSPPGAGSSNTDNYKTQPKMVKEPYSEQALREMQRGTMSQVAAVAPSPPEPSAPPVVARVEPKPAPAAVEGDEKVDWVWPAKGKIVAGFSEAASLKGIDIAGTAGQPINASAGGKVVYAGSGLRGYGKLIIVKHNNTYLSAYAHNKDILVKEGQQVTKGQKIAEMGSTDADEVKLHFEIRRNGKPMDPLKYLPPA
jgi:lipoprotein NlpD